MQYGTQDLLQRIADIETDIWGSPLAHENAPQTIASVLNGHAGRLEGLLGAQAQMHKDLEVTARLLHSFMSNTKQSLHSLIEKSNLMEQDIVVVANVAGITSKNLKDVYVNGTKLLRKNSGTANTIELIFQLIEGLWSLFELFL